MDDLNEILEIVRHYARGIWKNRWIAIVIAWPLMIGGIIAVDQIKDRYKAETQVYIDSSSVLEPLLRGLTISTDFQATVRLMVQKLLSRPNLERAIRLMDMDLNVQNPNQMDALINKVRSRVEITGNARTGTYTITYSDEIPQTARKMVQTLLDIFVEDTLGKSVVESDSAILFLDQQIAKYEKLLQEAEKRREDFKRKNLGLMPQDGANYFSQLQQLKGQLEDARLSLKESVNRRNQILGQLADMESEKVQQLQTSSHDERIEEQEVRLQDLLLMYTDEHPDVINAKLVIDTLKKRKEKELKELQQNSSPNLGGNPVYQELLIAKANLEGDISTLSTRVEAFTRKQKELEKLVDIVPAIESEMQKLNRDYEVHQKNYTELVERRETAKISEDVESGTEQVKFRIIEPPFVPARADYPNRVLFDVAVIIVSLGIGYGVGLLISLFQPVFYNTADLRKYTDNAVLGAISKVDTAQVLSQRRRNLMFFASANVVFLVMGGILTLLHSRGILILSDLQIRLMGL
jgi:polysaccharide chain length determinant protein (PEP-CTERM system associated)